MAFVEFRDVTKTYRMGDVEVRAVDGMTFDIERGELAVIVGPSGAGKTTVLNMLGGMDSATSGTIRLGDRVVSSLSERELTQYRRHDIGFVFQFYNLIPNLNVVENVDFGIEVKKDTFDSTEVLKKVKMDNRLKAFPSTLSGGEQQRVAIARAIAKKPRILLCDEPTGALDYENSKQVLEIIESLNRDLGMTVVLVTHNDALCPMADKVITVHDGKIKSVVENSVKVSVTELEW